MSDNKKYYWLRLKDDFFRDKEIKKLRKVAGGDTYTIIYLKLQLLSLRTEGKLYFDNLEETLAEELSLEIDEDAENIKITLLFLQKCGLIFEQENNTFILPQTVECIGGETQSALRVRRHRDKLKALHCNSCVTNCNVEKEKQQEIDLKKELELEKDGGKKSTAKSIVYSDEFLNVWDVIYPHSSDRGSKTQAYKNWLSLLKEGQPIEALISSAHNYKQHCSIKSESFRYRCSNFYGEKRYFENFITLNLTNLQKEVQNARHNQPTTFTQRCASGADFIRQLADAEAAGFDINDF